MKKQSKLVRVVAVLVFVLVGAFVPEVLGHVVAAGPSPGLSG